MAGKCIILMGVSGSGKSTIGLELSREIKAKFIDGDDLQPRVNIQKMAQGTALNDSDRMPWLERINDVIYSLNNKHETGVIVCSALKRRYRDTLRQGNQNIIFIYLKGSFDTILARLEARRGHFMPTTLLKSQFDTLEEPGNEEQDVLCIDIDTDIPGVLQRCITMLNQRQ